MDPLPETLCTVNKMLPDKSGDGSLCAANKMLPDKRGFGLPTRYCQTRGGMNILLELLYGRVGAVDRYSNKPYLLSLALKQRLTIDL